MLDIKNFFSKFKKIDSGRDEKIKRIIESVAAIAKINLKPEEIIIKENGAVWLNTSPIKRNEIFMGKEKILAYLVSNGVKITLN